MSNKLTDFRDSYLKNRKQIEIYRKSKTYARYGVYLSLFLWYIASILYLDTSVESYINISVFSLAIASSIGTIGLLNIRRTSNISRMDACLHDIAALIDAYYRDGYDGLLTEYAHVKRHLGDNELLSEVRRSSFISYMSKIEEDERKFDESNLEDTLAVIVDDVVRILEEEINTLKNKPEENPVGERISRWEMILSILDSDRWDSDITFWVVFVTVALLGIGVGAWKGQGWGILIVTILFAGLRYFDTKGN